MIEPHFSHASRDVCDSYQSRFRHVPGEVYLVPSVGVAPPNILTAVLVCFNYLSQSPSISDAICVVKTASVEPDIIRLASSIFLLIVFHIDSSIVFSAMST